MNNKIVYEIIHGGSLAFLFLILIALSKIINDFLTPYKIDDELTQKDNAALSVSICGYMCAVTIIFIGAIVGPDHSILKDIISVGGYTLVGIVLLNISRLINDKCILYTFSNVKEIIEDRNAGTGAVQCGSYISSGLIIAGAIHGEGGSILTALVFFLIGQVALILFTFVYNRITPFDIHAEIEKDNVAAGIAFGGTLIALGIILMKGASGDFISWKYNLNQFAICTGFIFLLLPVIRIFFDRIIIPQSSLNKEIKEDRNIGAAFLEATVTICFSTILFFTVL